MSLIQFTKAGMYCPRADVYIDPHRSVKKALITHGHSDHARRGHQHYLCTRETKPVIQHRLGKINVQAIDYGKKININGVDISFHPAGHIIGSAQIRLAYGDEVWVTTGDYKLVIDGISGAFEPVKCTHFVTETTFALPCYHWPHQKEIYHDMNTWWLENSALNRCSIVTAYSLGKAQRILSNIDAAIGPIYCHNAIADINQIFRQLDYDIPPTQRLNLAAIPPDIKQSLVLIPAGQALETLKTKIGDYATAAASGWMRLRRSRRNRNTDQGFILSDHADWSELNAAIQSSEAANIYLMHGYTDVFARYLREKGYRAHSIDAMNA